MTPTVSSPSLAGLTARLFCVARVELAAARQARGAAELPQPNAAIVAYLITAYLCFFFATIHFERLPDYLVMKGQGKYFDDVSLNCCAFAQVLAPLAFVFTFLFGHHFLRHGEQAFLDIACIDQRDDAAKRSGITSLGAILDRSQRMAVLLDENYMKRMWCVFELAAFAKRGSLSRMDILPLHTSMQMVR